MIVELVGAELAPGARRGIADPPSVGAQAIQPQYLPGHLSHGALVSAALLEAGLVLGRVGESVETHGCGSGEITVRDGGGREAGDGGGDRSQAKRLAPAQMVSKPVAVQDAAGLECGQ